MENKKVLFSVGGQCSTCCLYFSSNDCILLLPILGTMDSACIEVEAIS